MTQIRFQAALNRPSRRFSVSGDAQALVVDPTIRVRAYPVVRNVLRLDVLILCELCFDKSSIKICRQLLSQVLAFPCKFEKGHSQSASILI
jgi:hypothetical protein